MAAGEDTVTASIPLLFLGTGNAFAQDGRYWGSFLIDGRVLMEPSPAVLPNLRKAGADLAAIDIVFISHFHADHLFGWPFLLLEYLVGARRQGDLWVVGPPGVAERLPQLIAAGSYPQHSRERGGFDLHYVGADNERHRPVMIHRALFGSIERFFAILLEHYAGAFPTWLAPVQVTVLPVADRHDAYAHEVAAALRGNGVRVEVHDASADTLGARVRRAKVEKVPHVLVVGDDDVRDRTVGVNRRGTEKPERGVPLDRFAHELDAELAQHR